MQGQELLAEAHHRSVTYLLENSSEYGLMAASPQSSEGQHKSYTSLFSRDIGVSSIGMLASGNHGLIKVVRTSLANLAEAQSSLGQLPFYYRPEEKKVQWWTPGSIDSTLWWSIAFLLYYKTQRDEDFYTSYRPHLEKAWLWLRYQDTNNDMLLEQGEASDWADEMPRMGTVLYTNTLWYWLIRLRAEIADDSTLFNLQKRVHRAFNGLFWVSKEKTANTSYVAENAYAGANTFGPGLIEATNSQAVFLPYYLAAVSHKSAEMRCDVYGNILACLVGLASQPKREMIIDFIVRSGTNLPYPLQVLYPPIYPGESDWKTYMAKGRQNYPWQYQNGGIWPYVGGFWVSLLAQHQPELAMTELAQLAKANSLNGWEFNEYLHGQRGTPMGVPRQSWNMGMYLAAYAATMHALSLF